MAEMVTLSPLVCKQVIAEVRAWYRTVPGSSPTSTVLQHEAPLLEIDIPDVQLAGSCMPAHINRQKGPKFCIWCVPPSAAIVISLGT